MKNLILITIGYDDDSYRIFGTNKKDAKTAYKKAVKEADMDSTSSIHLLEVDGECEFGFGGRGDIFGAEIIDEKYFR